MRRITVAGLLSIAAVLVFTGAASAHTASFETTHPELVISVVAESDTGPWTTRGHGRLGSNRQACVSGRAWRLIGVIDGSRLILDKGRSSREGHWAFGSEGDNFSAVESLAFQVLKKRIRPRSHRHVCRGSTNRYYPI